MIQNAADLIHRHREDNMINGLRAPCSGPSDRRRRRGCRHQPRRRGDERRRADAEGPTPKDAGLTDAFLKDIASHSYPADGRVRFDWRLEPFEANGLIIREFGLIASKGSLFARKTRHAPIEKTDDISLDGAWTIIF